MNSTTHRIMTALRRKPQALAAGLALLLGLLLAVAAWAAMPEVAWRIKIREAAIISGERVLLREIATPVGKIDREAWAELGSRELWQAPPQPHKPMLINKPRLKEALSQYLGDMVELCMLPSSLAIQQGGGVVLQDELVRLVVNSLTAKAATLGGEPELKDPQTPAYMFLADPANQLDIELAAQNFKPGRVSLRIREIALDGRVVNRISASIQMDLWKTVPAAARPINPNEEILPKDVTFIRKNLAYTRDETWDGKGGPWRVKRPIGAGEPFFVSNLEPVPLIKRGDAVTLVFRGKHVHLQVPAVAMTEGGYNESITVRNLQTKVQVHAHILDAKTVQVF